LAEERLFQLCQGGVPNEFDWLIHSVTRIMMRGGRKLKYKRLCQAFLSASSRFAKKKTRKRKEKPDTQVIQ